MRARAWQTERCRSRLATTRRSARSCWPAVRRSDARPGLIEGDPPLVLEVDRLRARFGAWYELFPRSWGGLRGVAGAAAGARRARLRRPLPAADPPDRLDQPQGREQRAERRPGRSRLALGDRRRDRRPRRGPPRARHPRGPAGARPPRPASTASTSRSTSRCRPSADHPWLTEHPEWFHRRPDGTLKYAENPPKRYQDIYNFNWDCEDWQGLWEALREVMLGWVDCGVKVFRVDNPHTKPFAFWAWLIERGARARPRRRVPGRGVHPPGGDAPSGEDRLQPVVHVLHLEERALGARGVRQRARLLRRAGVLPPELLRQHARTSSTSTSSHGGRPAFEARAVLAATLSPSWGIYSGLRERGERAGARGLRGVPRLGEVRDQAALARRRAAAADRPAEPHAPGAPGAPGALERHLPRRRPRRDRRLRQADRRRHRDHRRVGGDRSTARRARSPSRPTSGCRRRFTVRDLLTGEEFAWRIGAELRRLPARACAKPTSSRSSR